MQENKRPLSYALMSVLALGVMSGCATQSNTAKAPESKPAAATTAAVTAPAAAPAAPAAAAQPVAAPTQHYFLVFHENGRIYPIADAKNYLAFLDVNELIYTRTRMSGPARQARPSCSASRRKRPTT
jgi:hypothetical protein